MRQTLYLFSHGFRVGDSCTEEAVPLQPAVQSGPVVVAVPSVWQTPRDQGVKLPVRRVAWLPYKQSEMLSNWQTSVSISGLMSKTYRYKPPAQVQTPLSAPVPLRPFFLSGCV